MSASGRSPRPPGFSSSRITIGPGKTAVRLGVDDLAAQIAALHAEGIETGELVVIADMVKVVDVADPDGNEVSFVQDSDHRIVPNGP